MYTDDQILELEARIKKLEQEVASEKIEKEIKSNNSRTEVIPGTACKIIFDNSGHIVGTDSLAASDIPTINIDQVSGLKNALEGKVSKTMIKEMNFADMISKGETIGTSCKVNYDKNGLIVGSAPLTENDIPILQINHIDGLTEEIEILKSKSCCKDESNESSEYIVNPGCGCKIKWDSHGHVISGEKLEVYDLPESIINSINSIQNIIPKLASASAVDSIRETIRGYVEKNAPISPGVFTKVSVDDNGLIVAGELLTIDDLPEITIDDVKNLSITLKDKVGIDEFNRLKDEVNMILNSITMQRINDVIDEKIKLNNSNSEINDLNSSIKDINNRIDMIISNMISQEVIDSINSIQSDLSSIIGRLSTLENKISK